MRIFFDTSRLDDDDDDDDGGGSPPPSDPAAAAARSAKVSAIRRSILPSVSSVWSSTLSLVRASSPLRVPSDACFGLYDIPPEHTEDGVEDADVVVLVSAAEELRDGTRLCYGDLVLAAAAPCELDQYDRPYVGLINFCLDAIDLHETHGNLTQSTIDKFTAVAVHEFAHALGANSDMFKYFRDPLTGDPLTPRPFEVSRGYECVNGAVWDVVVPGCSTIQRGTSSTGADFFEVVTPTVVQVARNQFDCQTLTGARLENQPTAADCFGTHWDERYYYSELMSGVYAAEADYLSPLTLALLEDTGWYRADFARAEVSPFGHGAGCGFVEGDCIVNGRVPEYSRGFFCNQIRENFKSMDAVMCDPSHTHKATCDLFNGQYPPYDHRYFPQMSVGPKFTRADWCPIASDNTIDCQDDGSSAAAATARIIPEERYGPSSRCFVSSSGTEDRSLCLESRCDADGRTLEVRAGDLTLVCDADFRVLSFESEAGRTVQIQCPRLSAACPDMFCPGNCSGKGSCDFSLPVPRCRCFDPGDNSPGCFGSGPVPSAERAVGGECSGGGPSRRRATTTSLGALAAAAAAAAVCAAGWV